MNAKRIYNRFRFREESGKGKRKLRASILAGWRPALPGGRMIRFQRLVVLVLIAGLVMAGAPVRRFAQQPAQTNPTNPPAADKSPDQQQSPAQTPAQNPGQNPAQNP